MTIHCQVCLRPVRRHWWQLGRLAPFPMCPRSQRYACRNLKLAREVASMRARDAAAAGAAVAR